MYLRRLGIVSLFLLIFPLIAYARTTAAERAANAYAAHEMASHPLHGNLPDYALSPNKLRQAVHLGELETTLYVVGTVWTIATLLLLLFGGVIARMRGVAERVGRWRWLHTVVFIVLLATALWLLNLPLAIYGHHVGLHYGFSVQSWASWFGDRLKRLVLAWGMESLLGLLLMWLLTRLPRRWWLAFWVASVPITLLAVALTPVVIDPMFNHFEPLALHHPALALQLEHMGVPASRQFLMQASAKVTVPNAYVTGLGPTRRLVVWDTSLNNAQGITPEVLWMVGHECGHYVLRHVLRGTLLSLAALLPGLFIAAWLLGWLLRRFGARWKIASPQDLGALAVLLLISVLMTTLTTPVGNIISRGVEHDADIYGQEAIHGLVPDPQRAAQKACDSMGLRTLDDPNPNPWVERLLYDHPATGRRAAFAHAYDPWAPGMAPKYFSEQLSSEQLTAR